MKARFGVVLFIASALLSPRLAAADPITLSSGFYIIDEEGDFFEFVSSGLVISGWNMPAGPHHYSSIGSLSCYTCNAGQEYAFGRETPGEVFLRMGSVAAGSIVVESARLSGHLKFVAPTVVLPPAGTSLLDYRVPFVLTGFIRTQDNDHPGSEIFTRVHAEGFASATFHPLQNGRWENNDGGMVRYEISGATPTPEPASLLLLVAGIAGVALRKRR